MLEMARKATDEAQDYYAFAARVVAEQRESDAQIADAAGAAEVAALIREAP